MESPCLSTRQQALKVGCFYWLRVKKFEFPSYRIELGSCLFRPMASLPPPSSPLHRLDLIEFVPNQILIESHIEIVRRSFIHCLIRLPVARKLPLVARWLRLVRGDFAWWRTQKLHCKSVRRQLRHVPPATCFAAKLQAPRGKTRFWRETRPQCATSANRAYW